MKLQSICNHYFDSQRKSRGRRYFDKDKVSVQYNITEVATNFIVKGSKVYECCIRINNDEDYSMPPDAITMSCTCSDFDNGNYCKHIWASILMGDSKNIWNHFKFSKNKIFLRQEDYEDPIDDEEFLFDDDFDDDFEDDFEDDFDDDLSENKLKEVRPLSNFYGRTVQKNPSRSSPKTWKNAFKNIKRQSIDYQKAIKPSLDEEFCYVIDIPETIFYNEGLCVNLFHWEKNQPIKKKLAIDYKYIYDLKNTQNKEILTLLLSYDENQRMQSLRYSRKKSSFYIPQDLEKSLLKKMCETKRLYILEHNHNKPHSSEKPVQLIEENCHVVCQITKRKDKYQVSKEFLRENSEKLPQGTILYTKEGSILMKNTAAFTNPQDFYWSQTIEELSTQHIPLKEGPQLIEFIYSQNYYPELILPDELKWEEVFVSPQPHLIIHQNKGSIHEKSITIPVEVKFRYEDAEAWVESEGLFNNPSESPLILPSESAKKLYKRDIETEKKYLEEAYRLCSATDDKEALKDSTELSTLGYDKQSAPMLKIEKEHFSSVIEAFTDKGWGVEADGKPVRVAQDFNLSVSSGIDWFDLKGEVNFGSGFSFSLSQLLKEVKKGKHFVTLGNGSLAMLPEKWLEKYSGLTNIGIKKSDSVRYTKAQGIFLNSFLSDEKNVKFDVNFKEFQKKVNAFHLQKEKSPSKNFQGKLRSYQKAGLSWLDYLQLFGFGGVLADDMGLGKTIQLLAFFQKQKEDRKKKNIRHKPSLIVVPKSLIFNWKSESDKFTPNLMVLPFVGAKRREDFSQIQTHDLILTTYHTLRRDYNELKQIDFYGVILDEAQTIKNPKAQISRVCKGLKGDYKLALTGTPIENSITDLFSIMDFANPGLISPKVRENFANFERSKVNISKDDEGSRSKELQFLNKALSPLILRRTKGEVLKDLPPKFVNTLKCTLSAAEMKNYTAIKTYYQSNLSKKFEKKGFQKSKVEVLEALLRLRQAACHPGLLDKKKVGGKSSKVEILFEHIHKLQERGHKCLVFSQFTSFLKIIENQCKKKKIKYCYLDGQTLKRHELVLKFQSEQSIKVFLISLKAGGVGLNLTSAEYVFILDPWWNPAAESQAIDRVHRIGQKNKVFAYKIIAKDTVEEKILQLQESKKELSDAIMSSNTSMLRKMTIDDLNFLLN